MESPFSRIILGTAQLGMKYGIANTTGRPEPAEVCQMLDACREAGINTFDTAQAYGDSESVLGAWFGSLKDFFPNVITKLAPGTVLADYSEVFTSLEASLKRLRLRTLFCVMLHREDLLPELDDAAGKVFSLLQRNGLVQNIGISVYSPKVAKQALLHPLISIVQIPSSLLDRRFEKAGIFSLARKLGKQIHIRSVLLQGVVCMAPEDLKNSLKAFRPVVGEFRKLCSRYSQEPAGVALIWALRRWEAAHCLIGVESLRQVHANIASLNFFDRFPPELERDLNSLRCPQDERLLNPSLWD